MIKILTKLLLSSILILSLSYIANADMGINVNYMPDNTPFPVDFAKEASDTNIGASPSMATVSILQVLAGGLLYFAGPVAVILIVINAFNMATGGADSEKLEQAKKGLTWTIAGLLLIILSYSIVKTVINTTVDVAEVTTGSGSSSSPSP